MILLEELTLSINKEIQKLKDNLVAPGVENYNEYKRVVGKIEGMEWSRDTLQHIIKQRLYEDED
jgi:hypothetical protein